MNEAGNRAGNEREQEVPIVNAQLPTSNSQNQRRLGNWELAVGSLLRSHPDRAVESNHFAVQHFVLENVPHVHFHRDWANEERPPDLRV